MKPKVKLHAAAHETRTVI